MISGYKLLRVRRDGTLGPLFINKTQVIPVGKWLKAEAHKTKGYAFRPGWHCTLLPVAPHLSKEGRVWCKVSMTSTKKYKRPESQGGTWVLAQRMRIDAILD
jgi:hypothetical protein